MTTAGAQALAAERDVLLDLLHTLDDDEWSADSRCAGWTVADVVIHLTESCRAVVEPPSAPLVPGDLEANIAATVAAARGAAKADVIADYERCSQAAAAAAAKLQRPDLADRTFDLDNAGTYEVHLLANALAFDHHCHLRHDILAPGGPIHRQVASATNGQLRASVEWLIAGLLQMSGAPLHAATTAVVVIDLTGPDGGTWNLQPSDYGLAQLHDGDTPAWSARLTSPAEQFVLWGTHRHRWQACEVIIEGDEALGRQVLDAIHVF